MAEEARTATATTTPASARRPVSPGSVEKDDLVNAVLADRYQIERRIGAGGMGVVYAGRDVQLDRPVAIKLVNRPDDSHEAQERLGREARAMAKLRHPNVATVHDVGTTRDRFFIVMELVESGTLADWLKASRRAWRQVVPLFLQAARGLAAAHAAGIIHRDFKPENVLLGKDGIVRVTDFGVVRLIGDADLAGDPPHSAAPSDTVTGGVVGTAGYIAPEILKQEGVDARADQFSFCVALYAALCGKRPFEITNGASPISESLGIIRPIPHGVAPRWLQRIIRRGLSPSPLNRWPSMAALAAEIERYLGRHRRATVLTAAGLIIVLATAVATRRTSPPRPIRTGDLKHHRPVTFTGNARSVSYSPDGTIFVYQTQDQLHVADLSTHRDDVPSGIAVGSYLREYRRWLPDSSAFEIVALVEADGADPKPYVGVRIPRGGGAASLIPPPWRGGYSRDGSEIASAKITWKHIEIHHGAEIARTVPIAGPYDALLVYEWSPDGQWLLVGTVTGDTVAVHLLSADGSQWNRLYEQGFIDGEEPHFAPLGDGVLYLRRHSHEDKDLMFLPVAHGRADGGARVLIEGLQAEDFSIDHGGKALIYTRSVPPSKLWSVTVDDDESAQPAVRPQRLLADTASKKSVSISPDGQQIVYIAQEGLWDELFVKSVRGGNPQPLQTPEGNKCGSAWSPDGKELAFVIAGPDGAYSLWISPLDGGQARRLATVPHACELHWAQPSTIAVASADSRNFTVVDLATGGERPLFRDASLGWASRPVWSPDGRSVAVYWNRRLAPDRAYQKGLWLVASDGAGGKTERPLLGGAYIPLGWSADGSWIYAFVPVDSNNFQQVTKTIVRIPAAGGAAEPWVTLPIEGAIEDCSMSPGGRQLACISGAESDVWMIKEFDRLLRD